MQKRKISLWQFLRFCTMRVSWLNLHRWIPQKDVRKLIYGYLTDMDRILVEFAHLSNLKILPFRRLTKHCARYGYLDLLKWTMDVEKVKHFYFSASKKAVKHNQIEIVNYMILNEPNLQKIMCRQCAWVGNLEMLKLIWVDGSDTAQVAKNAAYGKQIHVLDWLEQKPDGTVEMWKHLIDEEVLFEIGAGQTTVNSMQKRGVMFLLFPD